MTSSPNPASEIERVAALINRNHGDQWTGDGWFMDTARQILAALNATDTAKAERIAVLEGALNKIAGGSIPDASTFAVRQDWHGFVMATQAFADAALGSKKG